MSDSPPHLEAAAVLSAKAARLRAIAADPRIATVKQQQIAALERIASVVAAGDDAIAAGISNSTEFSRDDRSLAASEIHALAVRREQQGTIGPVDGARPPPGFERGGNDFRSPVHKATLLHAAMLYDIALALSYEEYWAYTKGLLLENLGDYPAAIRSFENLPGTYAEQGRTQAERCRHKLVGSYDAKAQARSSFDDNIRQFSGRGVDASHLRYAKDVYLSALDSAMKAPQHPALASVTSISAFEKKRRAHNETLDRASAAAQWFGERLAYGDFAGAQAMLAAELSELSAYDLRDAYWRMTTNDGDDAAPGDVPQVTVGSVMDDTPGMTIHDLGHTYVSIMGERFVEAVSVTVTEEHGEARIRELEWGRP